MFTFLVSKPRGSLGRFVLRWAHDSDIVQGIKLCMRVLRQVNSETDIYKLNKQWRKCFILQARREKSYSHWKLTKKKITKTSTKILSIFPIRSFFVSFFNSMWLLLHGQIAIYINHYLRIKLEIKRFKTSTFNLLMWNLPKSRNSSKFSTLSFKHHSWLCHLKCCTTVSWDLKSDKPLRTLRTSDTCIPFT